MRWIWAAAEAFAQWRASRAQSAYTKWLKRARKLRDRQERVVQPDLFEEGRPWGM